MLRLRRTAILCSIAALELSWRDLVNLVAFAFEGPTVNKLSNAVGPRPSDTYDRILQSHNKAAKRLVEELRRRYFDVDGKTPSEVTTLVMRGELRKRVIRFRASQDDCEKA